MAAPERQHRQVAQNRKARHDYFIEDTVEAGIVLTGTEVKSLRAGHAQIAEAHAAPMDGELWLFNAYIAEYEGGNRFNHETRRPRKLLLHRREIDKLMGAVDRQGMTLVPLSIYWSKRGRAKVELALAKGKQKHDKRDTIREREWQRARSRLLRPKD